VATDSNANVCLPQSVMRRRDEDEAEGEAEDAAKAAKVEVDDIFADMENTFNGEAHPRAATPHSLLSMPHRHGGVARLV
jgi:hypothetical protein